MSRGCCVISASRLRQQRNSPKGEILPLCNSWRSTSNTRVYFSYEIRKFHMVMTQYSLHIHYLSIKAIEPGLLWAYLNLAWKMSRESRLVWAWPIACKTVSCDGQLVFWTTALLPLRGGAAQLQELPLELIVTDWDNCAWCCGHMCSLKYQCQRVGKGISGKHLPLMWGLL